MTEMEYKIMNEKEHIHWFCPTCDAKVMKNLKIDETRVREMIKEANIELKPDKVIEVMEVVKDETIETKEREKRLNNVIIVNLPESNSQLKSNRLKHDRELVLELCTEVNKDFVDTYITEHRRLGEANDDKTRPVFKTLSENEKKRGLLGKFFHLKESQKFKNIKIDHDKTKQEREE